MKKIMTLAVIALASVAMVSCCGQNQKKADACCGECCKDKAKTECCKPAETPAPAAEAAPAAETPAPEAAPAN
uniref:hypothetical protein n=1 Tax=Alistipes sp. TaxID=1872444 RepID=UPI004056FD0B